jgi:hypothetical protein
MAGDLTEDTLEMKACEYDHVQCVAFNYRQTDFQIIRYLW